MNASHLQSAVPLPSGNQCKNAYSRWCCRNTKVIAHISSLTMFSLRHSFSCFLFVFRSLVASTIYSSVEHEPALEGGGGGGSRGRQLFANAAVHDVALATLGPRVEVVDVVCPRD